MSTMRESIWKAVWFSTVASVGVACLVLTSYRHRCDALAANYESNRSGQRLMVERLLAKRRQEQAGRHREEWIRAAGGEAGLRELDPSRGITGYVESVAASCVPAGARVHVGVDRFVEFRVEIDLAGSASAEDLLAQAVCFLPRVMPYVREVVWHHRDRVVAALDARVLESVVDWQRVGDLDRARLLARLTGSDAVEAAATQVEAPAKPAEEEDSSPETAAIKKAFAILDERREILRDAINKAGAQTKLGGVRDRAALNARRLELRVQSQRMVDLVGFYRGPDSVLRPTTEGLHPVLRRALHRELTRRTRPAEEVIRAALDYTRAQDGFLESLEDHWGQWSVGANGIEYRFIDAAASKAFEGRSTEVQRASDALDRAIKIWDAARTVNSR